MKGHMENGKFHPHTEYKKGIRKSRDQTAKSTGVKVERKARLTVSSSSKSNTPTELIQDYGTEQIYKITDVVAEPMITRRIPSNLYVHIIDMEEATGDEFDKDKKYNGEVILVPQWKYLHPKVKESIIESSGMSVKEFEEGTGAGKGGEGWVMDLISYYGGIRLGSDEQGGDPKELKQRLADKSGAYAGMIGFFLDNAWNGVGNTGWDSLKQLTKNKDLPRWGTAG